MLFLEEIWSRNFTNLFIAPMKISEIIISLVFTALIRALIGLVPAILLTSPLFGISLLKLGLPLAFLFLSLYLFGITLGLLVSAGLLRFGPSFENIAWSTMFLLAPFWLHLLSCRNIARNFSVNRFYTSISLHF